MKKLLLTVFGLGLLRPAPGTWGSLPLPLIVFGLVAAGVAEPVPSIVALAAGVFFSWACLQFGTDAEAIFGKKDPGQVVADEVGGQAIPLLFLPWRADDPLWNGALCAIAFATFRLFDITKPPPAKGLQRLPAGQGILVDDLIAGVYAAAVTQLAARFLLPAVL